jgi:hypothetical protein
MVCIGDYAKCPECTRMGRIVWISDNKSVVGIQCAASHNSNTAPDSEGLTHKVAKSNKNSVFLVKTEPEQTSV